MDFTAESVLYLKPGGTQGKSSSEGPPDHVLSVRGSEGQRVRGSEGQRVSGRVVTRDSLGIRRWASPNPDHLLGSLHLKTI